MKKIYLATFLLGLSLSASAELRFINGTDKDLKVDILHASGSVTDIALPAGVPLSGVVGPKVPFGDGEMVVLKTADGTEIKRQEMQSGNIMLISGNSPGFSYVGYHQGKAYSGKAVIINATGAELAYKGTHADFSLYDGVIEKPDAYNGMYKVSSVTAARTLGEVIPYELTVGGKTTRVDLTCGAVYLAKRAADGTVTLEKVGTV